MTQLEEFLRKHPGIAFVDACFADLCGTVRGKRIPVDEAEKIWNGGVFIPYSTYCLNARGANEDPCGLGFTDGDPDGRGVVVDGTLTVVPWTTPRGAQVLMRLVDEHGAPCDIEPRAVLAQVVDAFAAIGLRPQVAFELEFYLFDRNRPAGHAPRVAPLPDGSDEHASENVYDLSSLDARSAYFNAVRDACRLQNINASVVTSEYAKGQYEINLHYRPDAVAAADECILFRRLISAVAANHSARASFMAKPFAESSGSGMHLHVSLLDADGNNVFDSDKNPDAASLLGHAIAGCLESLGDAMAIFAPNINAFRRYQPETFVPVNRTWAHNNRSVAVRIPAGGGAGTRIEHRVAGADANPYLALAAVLVGVLDGLNRKLDPGPATRENACAFRDESIAWTVPDAVDALQLSALFRQHFGGRYIDVYTETKRREFARFMGDILDREYDWYI